MHPLARYTDVSGHRGLPKATDEDLVRDATGFLADLGDACCGLKNRMWNSSRSLTNGLEVSWHGLATTGLRAYFVNAIFKLILSVDMRTN